MVRFAALALAVSPMLATSLAPAAPHDDPSSLGAEGATIYTCPMHPDVTSNEPGRCPKCGMKLVVKATVPPSSKIEEGL